MGTTTTTTTTTQSPPESATAAPLNLRHELETKGYVLIPSLLNASSLSVLRATAAEATTSARAGSWPHIRTLPKQFPPWPSTAPAAGIWGVQHLLHPSLPQSDVFARSYFNPKILVYVCEILSCKSDDLVMELYNLLVRPEEDFALRWHRDDIPPSATAEEERAVLSRPITHAQWNLALYDDESLLVVPGSQSRPRTEAERSADPYAESVEGMEVVRMKAGDCVFYDNNILHTGRYRSDRERATLHGSMGIRTGSEGRARNVLQHGVGEWVGDCDFSVLPGTWEGRKVGDVAESMRRSLMEMGSGKGVGFSQGGDE